MEKIGKIGTFFKKNRKNRRINATLINKDNLSTSHHPSQWTTIVYQHQLCYKNVHMAMQAL